MYALPTSADRACYLCVPPDPGIEPAALGAGEAATLGASASPALGAGEAAALGASTSTALGTGEAMASGAGESALSGTAPTAVSHTFTLDSRASRSFFRDCTTLTPLNRPVPVSLADPSGVPVLAHYSTVLPCPAAPSGSLSGLYLPSFSTKLIRAVRLQLRERFRSDFPVLRLHSDRGGEFSSDLLAAYCAERGIRQTFTLPASPQQNGVAERRIGLVMEVARTSMIHAAAPHFVWPFAVRYAAHQLNLWPRVSLPETSPTLLWTGKVGDASRFRVWGARAFVRDTTADKLSARAVPCVFLGFVLDAPGWQFYHPSSRRVFASQDDTFDESVPFYRHFPYRTASLPPPAALPRSRCSPGPTEGGPARGATSVGAEPGGAEPGGAEPGGTEPEGAELEGVEPGGAEPECEGSGGAELGCTDAGGSGATEGAGAGGSGAVGGPSTGGAGAGGSGAAEGARAGGSGAVGATGAVGTDTGGSGAVGGAGAEGSESAVARSPWSSRLRPRVPLTSQQLQDWSGAGPLSTGGAGVAGSEGARTGGTGAAGAGGAASGGAAAGDTETGDPGTGGAGSGGAAAGDTEVGDPGTGGVGSGTGASKAAGGAGAAGAWLTATCSFSLH
ncbi:unnamed protein product [Closterium sp. Yama58-4]|nr:unnamed protein product [Closterium sp. Yama58-4]